MSDEKIEQENSQDNNQKNETGPTKKRDQADQADQALPLPQNAKVMHLVDALLKSPQTLYNHVRNNDLHRHVVQFLLIFSVCVLCYGCIVGSFSGQMQWIAAPLKIFLGTCLAVLLCFPSLYILSALSGTDLRPAQLASLLCGSLALIGILLIGFAPVTFVFTFSIKALPFMGSIHLLVWGISLYFGLRWLSQGLTALGSGNQKMIKIWAIILLVTLLQMSTTLRPILGTSDQLFTAEKKFFLVHWVESMHLN
ncbi:Yip1 domain protein [Candidatus Electrothrix gigas]